ncbi:ADP ribosylation factor [Pelomyxa schiedti]|nr:ADP ribosylation factor [Pelomyxa schiedti]
MGQGESGAGGAAPNAAPSSSSSTTGGEGATKPMDWELKHKFAKGAAYNMKVLIRGDRNTGKTCLWRRLQGMQFQYNYDPTEQIQVATINWDYKVTDDIVKVEVWDVVDKGKPKKKNAGLKISLDQPTEDTEDDIVEEEPTESPSTPKSGKPEIKTGQFQVGALDARTIDVMRGTDGVVFMFDITKRWTFEYITRELPKLPPTTFVLICANFMDMEEHRQVSSLEASELVRERNPNFTVYVECCMKNGYGMKTIASFFNLPFLNIQRQNLLRQLERNSADIKQVSEELTVLSQAQSYDMYLQSLEAKKSLQKNPATPPTQPRQPSSGQLQQQGSSPALTSPPTTGSSPTGAKAPATPTTEPSQEHKATTKVPTPELVKTPEPVKPKPSPEPAKPEPKVPEPTPKPKPEAPLKIANTEPTKPKATPEPAKVKSAPEPVKVPEPKGAEPKVKPPEVKPKAKPAPAKIVKPDPKKQKEEELKAIEALKAMATKPTGGEPTVENAEDFVPGETDLDDEFFNTIPTAPPPTTTKKGAKTKEKPKTAEPAKKTAPVMIQEESPSSDEDDSTTRKNPLVVADLDPDDE